MTTTTVEYGIEYLVNTENFENLKVVLHVTDLPREGESVNDATERIAKFVEAKVVARVQAIREEVRGLKA